jgi:peroxiredoxin
MPVLDELHNQYKALGFTVLGVNVEENPQQARKLLKDMPVSFPVLFDDSSVVSKQYDVIAMPSTVLVDRNGNMRYLHKGYKPGLEEIYLKQVRELVRE